MRNDLYISTESIFNQSLRDDDLAVMLALNGLIVGALSQNCINIKVLCYSLFGRHETRKERERVKRSVQNLEKHGYIKNLDYLDNSTFKCDVEKIFVHVISDSTSARTYYVKITKSELHKILNVQDPVDNFKLLRVFVCYVDTFHKGDKIPEQYKGIIGYMPIKYISSIARLNEKTLYKYNKVLEKNEIMYFVRYKISKDESSVLKVSGVTNSYSRYSNKMLCDYFANESTAKAYDQKSLMERNSKLKYSQLLVNHNAGKDYPLKVLYEIKGYIEEYNLDVQLGLREGELISDKGINKCIAEKENSVYCELEPYTYNDERIEYDDYDFFAEKIDVNKGEIQNELLGNK